MVVRCHVILSVLCTCRVRLICLSSLSVTYSASKSFTLTL
uniref:Uncharacterized protein n=1 Tax=Arundo donax TaxID=35708 RepID=A0A0A9EBI0_ARUDO